jgi:hypothetical protein
MAYDPNDAADKAIVQGLIDEALEAANEAHEAEVLRLTNKNSELLGKIKKLRTGNGDGANNDEIQRLETELEDTRTKLATAETAARDNKRALDKVTKERDEAAKARDSENQFSSNMLIENALTSALTEANVAPQFMEAAKALLSRGATVKVDGDNRTVVVNDKSIADVVKEFAAGDTGKHMIKAPANGGGGSNGANGGGNGGEKKLADMSQDERTAMARDNPTAWNALLAANNISITA